MPREHCQTEEFLGGLQNEEEGLSAFPWGCATAVCNEVFLFYLFWVTGTTTTKAPHLGKVKGLWFKIRIDEPKPALKLSVRLSNSKLNQDFQTCSQLDNHQQHKPHSYGWHCLVMSLQQSLIGVCNIHSLHRHKHQKGTNSWPTACRSAQQRGHLLLEKHSFLAVPTELFWGHRSSLRQLCSTLCALWRSSFSSGKVRQSTGLLGARAGAACNLDIPLWESNGGRMTSKFIS